MSVNFTPATGKRILEATRAIERSNQNPGTGYRRSVTAPMRYTLRGKLDAKVEQGGTAKMSVWAFTNGSEAATGEKIDVYDWLLKAPASQSQPKPSIAAGKKVVATWCPDSQRWYVTAAECP